MTRESEHSAGVRREIDEVLWLTWDPIGVSDTREARREYTNYVGSVFALLERGATEWELANHLVSLERTSMGLAGQLELARNAARRLLEIDLRPSRKLTLTRVELARRIDPPNARGLCAALDRSHWV